VTGVDRAQRAIRPGEPIAQSLAVVGELPHPLMRQFQRR